MNPLTSLVVAGIAAPAMVFAGSVALVPAPAGAPVRMTQSQAEAPKLIVVKFHADWCGKCKALAQPLAEAKANVSEQPVLFVEMDFTDRNTARQSEFLASITGLDGAWTEHERRTGFALLIDPASGTVLETLGDPDAQAITDAITKHL